MMEVIIEDMKRRIPYDPVLKKYLERLMAEGLSKDEALDIMVNAWLEHQRSVIYD